MRVRLRTDERTGKSKGMAFVECDTAEALHACVALHHASLDGRRINVEKSAGGGKAVKRQRLGDKREKQRAKVETTVARVVAEFEKDGSLRPGEVDDGVRKLLARRSGRVAQLALQEYCSLEGRENFDNPAAYLTKIVCRITDEEDLALPAKLHSAAKAADKKLKTTTSKVTPAAGAPVTVVDASRPAQKSKKDDAPAASDGAEEDSEPRPAKKSKKERKPVENESDDDHKHDLAAIFPALRS